MTQESGVLVLAQLWVGLSCIFLFLAKGVRRYLGPKEELGWLRHEDEEGGPAGLEPPLRAKPEPEAKQSSLGIQTM